MEVSADSSGLAASQLLKMVPARPQEFLDMFATPVELDLDSERVWPVPQPLKF